MERKHRLFILLIILSCTLCSCSSKGNSDNCSNVQIHNMDLAQQNKDSIKNTVNTECISEQVIMSIEPGTITKDSLKDITVKIVNNYEEPIIVGEQYILQIVDEINQFKDIPIDLPQNDLGISISSGDCHIFYYDLSELVTEDIERVYYIKKSAYINQIEYELTSSFNYVKETSLETISPNKINKDDVRDTKVDAKKQMYSPKKGDGKVDNKPSADIDSAKQMDSQKLTDNIMNFSSQIKIECIQDNTEKITVIITNNSDYEITVGEEYRLQKLNDEKWEEIPISIIWNDLGISIPPGKSHSFQYEFNTVVTLEKEASYRIIKSVYYNQTKMDLICNFKYK